jgi:hypothetical protein
MKNMKTYRNPFEWVEFLVGKFFLEFLYPSEFEALHVDPMIEIWVPHFDPFLPASHQDLGIARFFQFLQ